MGSCISKLEEVKIVEQKVDKPSQSTDFAEDKRDAYVN